MKRFITRVFPYDKLLHFTAGTYIAMTLSSTIAWWGSLLIVFIAAVSVEAFDKISKKGTAEILDIIYTLAGWGVTFVILR